MTELDWASRARPVPGSDVSMLGRWEPATPADLTTYRLELASALHDGARRSAADEGAVERLLLVFEELVSNALRHGRAPVLAEVTAFDDFWLVDVSDAAIDQPPALAVGRDAARGGLGLYLVARLCGAYGWSVGGPRKHVWGRVDYEWGTAPVPVPRPRGGSDRA